MNTPTKELLRKCQLPLLLIFATAPIPLFLYAGFAPDLLHYSWTTPALYGIFASLSFLIPGKYRLRYGIAATILLIILGCSVLKVTPSPFLVAAPVFYGGLLLWSLPMAGWSSDEELPGFWYWGGLLIHIVAQAVKFFVWVFFTPIFDPTAPWLLISFFAFAVLAMLSMTRSNMASASNGRQSPASMRRKNLILTLICFSIALLVSLMPAIIQAIQKFFSWLLGLLRKLFENRSDISDVPVTPQSMGDDAAMLPAEQSDPSILSDIFNALFLVLGSILIIAIIVVLIKLLVKAVGKLWHHLLSNLSDYAANTAEDYIDEVTDTRTAAPRQKKPRFSAVDERTMTPAQRIRYRYLRLLYKHRDWERGSTAREHLPDKTAALYEKARYSDHPITQEEAARFVSETKRV